MRVAKPEDYFCIGGGAIRDDADCYVERPADMELLSALKRKELCLLFGPRQNGKSSLVVQCCKKLRQEGAVCAWVDLHRLSCGKNPKLWLYEIISLLEYALGPEHNPREWWMRKKDLPPRMRFMRYFGDVLLHRYDNDVVIFFDEVDKLLDLHSSDEFFAAVRALYNERAESADLPRVAFALVGCARPSDLIKNRVTVHGGNRSFQPKNAVSLVCHGLFPPAATPGIAVLGSITPLLARERLQNR